MTEPAWLAVGLAGLMIVIAAGSAARLVMAWLRARGTEFDADGLHVLMGAAMAGMLEPRLRLLPAVVWLAVFAAAAAWFVWQAVRARARTGRPLSRCAHPVPHAVECLAMVYMLGPALRSAGHGAAMAMPTMTGSPAGAAGNPALALILALVMLGSVFWTTDRLASSRFSQLPTTAAAVGPKLAPRLAGCAKIAMSITMGYMLLTMV